MLFHYNGTVYQQIFGAAMGSPVLVVVANMVMVHIKDLALSMSPIPTIFLKRYVDDGGTSWPNEMLAHINSIDHNIQLTLQREGHTILFLDVKIMHNDDGSLTTKVYWKPTHTDQYFQFSSRSCIIHPRKWWLGYCWILMFKSTWSPSGHSEGSSPIRKTTLLMVTSPMLYIRSIVMIVMLAMLVRWGEHLRPVCQSTARQLWR